MGLKTDCTNPRWRLDTQTNKPAPADRKKLCQVSSCWQVAKLKKVAEQIKKTDKGKNLRGSENCSYNQTSSLNTTNPIFQYIRQVDLNVCEQPA